MTYVLMLLKSKKLEDRERKRQYPRSGVGYEYPYNEFAPNFVAFKPYIGPASLGNYMRIARKLAQPIQKGTKQSYQKQLQLLRAEPKATTWNMLNPRGLLLPEAWVPRSTLELLRSQGFEHTQDQISRSSYKPNYSATDEPYAFYSKAYFDRIRGNPPAPLKGK